MRMGNNRAGRTALGAAAARGVKHMAHRFIVGESPRDALGVFTDLWKDGVASSVDLLGEATVTQAEAQRYAQRCDEALETLVEAMGGWPERPHLERDSFGSLPRANLSVKVSRAHAADAPRRARARPARRRPAPARRCCARPHELGAHLHIDMESMDSRDAVLELILALLAEEEFRAGPSAGVVLQAYLRDSPQTLDTIVEWISGAGASRAQPLTVRLVKGAYWDHEIVEATQHGWLPPVFEVKADSDLNFEHLTRGLSTTAPSGCGLRAGDRVAQPALGRARDRLQPPRRRRRRRHRAADPARPRRPAAGARSPPRACACAPTARSATSSPAWPTSCGGCSRTRATTRSCSEQAQRRAARAAAGAAGAPA